MTNTSLVLMSELVEKGLLPPVVGRIVANDPGRAWEMLGAYWSTNGNPPYKGVLIVKEDGQTNAYVLFLTHDLVEVVPRPIARELWEQVEIYSPEDVIPKD